MICPRGIISSLSSLSVTSNLTLFLTLALLGVGMGFAEETGDEEVVVVSSRKGEGMSLYGWLRTGVLAGDVDRLLELEAADGRQGSSGVSSITKPAKASKPGDNSRAATPYTLPETRLTLNACGLSGGARVKTSIRSSKHGRATQLLKPGLIMVIRFESLTASSSSLSDGVRFLGIARRDAKAVIDWLSDGVSFLCSSNRCIRRVRCKVDSVDSLCGREETVLQDRGKRGTPGRFSRGGAEKGGMRALVVKEWANA